MGRYAYRLAGSLAADVDLCVVTGPQPIPLDGVELCPLPDLTGSSIERYYRAPIDAARLVREFGPDVVHSHGDDFALLFGPRCPPTVRTYYGRSSAEAHTGRLVRRVNHRVLGGLELVVRPRLAAAVGIGPDSARAFSVDALIPPIVPGSMPAFVAEPTSGRTVLFIGGHNTKKRGHLACSVVEAARRSCAVTFVVVGPEQDRDRYPDWVEFHSDLSDAEVRSLLDAATVLLAPSSYEGFGIPAWEAMAGGTAVLGTSNPGFDFVSDGGSAAAVVPEAALTQELLRLLRDEPYRRALILRGRRRAEQLTAMADPTRYLHLFEAVAHAA